MYLAHHPTSYSQPAFTAGMDIMHIPGARSKPDLVHLKFQRPAKVFIFLGVQSNIRTTFRPSLPGWKTEGFSTLRSSEFVQFGVHQTNTFQLPKTAYVFSKMTGRSVIVPTRDSLERRFSLFPVTSLMHIRVAEANGRPSPSVGKFMGRFVKPNAECPSDLHSTWAVRHQDRSDSTISGIKFATWHPTWDPCFWCAYNHDHGSSSKYLMNYEPTFGYTARKNNFQNESHEGFKGFVFRQGDHMIYYSLHAQTSHLRRMTASSHTIVLAVSHVRSGELLVELTQKGDFGFLGGRGRNGGIIPLRYEDVQKEKAQRGVKGARLFRVVNVIGYPGSLDRRLAYNPNVLEGLYEAWMTVIMCSKTPAYGGLGVDFETPGTAVRGLQKESIKKVVRLQHEKLNTGMSRNIHINDVVVSGKYCSFGNKEGVFYTDPLGQELLNGPGRGAVRQYIKKGVQINMSGKFKVGSQQWLGLFEEGKTGSMLDHGYGVDPLNN